VWTARYGRVIALRVRAIKPISLWLLRCRCFFVAAFDIGISRWCGRVDYSGWVVIIRGWSIRIIPRAIERDAYSYAEMHG